MSIRTLIDVIDPTETYQSPLDRILSALSRHLVLVNKNRRDMYVPANRSNPPAVQIMYGRIFEIAVIDAKESSSICVIQHGKTARYRPDQIEAVQTGYYQPAIWPAQTD